MPEQLPPGVASIIGMECFERFAYYGFRAILTLYLEDDLGLTQSWAISTFEFTSSLAYASPLVGGWLADGGLGKYKTIFYLGSVYCVGLWVLVVAAARRSLGLTMVALVLAGLGTGGIKPCVSSFGADQFPDDNDGVRRYFALFYGAINVGSVASFLLTPLVRARYGYATAFALPAILLGLALMFFVAASDLYVVKNEKKKSSDNDNFYTTLRTAVASLLDKDRPLVRGGVVNDDDDVERSWHPRGGPSSENDVMALQRVFRVLVTLPIFWMLYDQQGSVWTLQAKDMRLTWGLQPEQLGVANPVIILLLLPFFEKVAYPRIEARLGKGALAPTARIKAGMAVTAVSFVVAALVDAMLPLSVLWQLPQIFLISVGEILVSVTGLEYSYAEAPPAYRALVTSAYLLTTAIGDALAGVLYAVLGPFVSRTTLLLACAGAMVAVVGLVAKLHDGDDDVSFAPLLRPMDESSNDHHHLNNGAAKVVQHHLTRGGGGPSSSGRRSSF